MRLMSQRIHCFMMSPVPAMNLDCSSAKADNQRFADRCFLKVNNILPAHLNASEISTVNFSIETWYALLAMMNPEVESSMTEEVLLEDRSGRKFSTVTQNRY